MLITYVLQTLLQCALLPAIATPRSTARLLHRLDWQLPLCATTPYVRHFRKERIRPLPDRTKATRSRTAAQWRAGRPMAGSSKIAVRLAAEIGKLPKPANGAKSHLPMPEPADVSMRNCARNAAR